jgi:hypothetical protein
VEISEFIPAIQWDGSENFIVPLFNNLCIINILIV